MNITPDQLAGMQIVCTLLSTGAAIAAAVLAASQRNIAVRQETIAKWQEAAAKESLEAAWRIAEDQKKRAEEAERQRLVDFQKTMLALAAEALSAMEACIAKLDSGTPDDVLMDVGLPWLTLQRAERAARAALPTAPAHARLAIAAVELAEALGEEGARTAALLGDLRDVLEYRNMLVLRAEDSLKAAL